MLHTFSTTIRRWLAAVAVGIVIVSGSLVASTATASAQVTTPEGAWGRTSVSCLAGSPGAITITPGASNYAWNNQWMPVYAAAYFYSYNNGTGRWATTWIPTGPLSSNSATVTAPSGNYLVYVVYLWYTSPTTYRIAGEWIGSYNISPYFTRFSSTCHV